MSGWVKVKAAASYAGVSERTVEEWLKSGLRCSRLPSGMRLIKLEWLDQFLEGFADSSSPIDKIVDDVFEKI